MKNELNLLEKAKQDDIKFKTIFIKEKNYIIYDSNETNLITIYTEDDTIKKKTAKFIPYIMKIKLFSAEDYDRNENDIACLLNSYLQGEETGSIENMNNLYYSIKKRKMTTFNKKYIWGYATFLAIYIVLLILYYLFEELYKYSIPWINNIVNLNIYFECAFTGCIGGLLSITLSFAGDKKKILFHEIKPTDYYINGLIKLLTSAIAGAGICLLCKAKVIFGNIDFPVENLQDSSRFVLYALGFISGFSERYLPSFINQFETNNPDKDE